MTPVLGPLFLALLGLPALLPIGLGAWNAAKASDSLRSKLLLASVVGLPISLAAIWAIIELLNDTSSPLNIPINTAALVLGGWSVGIVVGRFWRGANWLIRSALVLFVLMALVGTGLIVLTMILVLGGVH